jgi:flavin reductase (DIM6/NTAB) family NADH-FMN oxidoreductase RutF
MDKIDLKPQTMLMPLPAAMVSCQAEGYKPNIITISWIGIVNSDPPMLSISVTPKRHSYGILKKAGEFVVNLTSEENLEAVDFCGSRSGRDYDKFREMNLTMIPGKIVSAPLIKECPINLECRVKQSQRLGSHEMFIAEIVAVHADRDIVTSAGKPDLEKFKLLSYCPVAREYRGGLKKLKSR